MEKVAELKTQAESGDIVILDVLKERIETSTMRGKSSTLSKLAELRTKDGRPVNSIDDQTFQIVETGAILKLVRE